MADPRETLASIRAQADAATEGPWEHEPPPGPGEDPMRPICVYPKGDGGTLAYVQPLEADAEFITAARTDVPWLLEQVEIRDKALDAVMELHRPVLPYLLDVPEVCEHCSDNEAEREVAYPCPTVAKVEAKLKGGA